jgi:hypothetical protein
MRWQICHAPSEIHSVPVLTHVSTFGIGEKCEIKVPDIRGAECPEGGIMIRISVLSLMFALAVGVACAQQLPPQPRPVASAMGQGNDQERAACHPDVTRFCQAQLKNNPDDVLGILGFAHDKAGGHAGQKLAYLYFEDEPGRRSAGQAD